MKDLRYRKAPVDTHPEISQEYLEELKKQTNKRTWYETDLPNYTLKKGQDYNDAWRVDYKERSCGRWSHHDNFISYFSHAYRTSDTTIYYRSCIGHALVVLPRRCYPGPLKHFLSGGRSARSFLRKPKNNRDARTAAISAIRPLPAACAITASLLTKGRDR